MTSLIIDDIIHTGENDSNDPEDNTVAKIIAKGIYHLIDVLIVASYIYLFLEIQRQYDKIRRG